MSRCYLALGATRRTVGLEMETRPKITFLVRLGVVCKGM